MFLSAATSLFLFTLSIKDGYLVSASTSELSHGHVFTNHHQISDSVSNVLNDATDLEADKKDENVSDSCSVPSMYNFTNDELERGVDLGVPQAVLPNTNERTASRIPGRIAESREYMEKLSSMYSGYNITTVCQNRHELCTFWAVLDQCEVNPTYMNEHCAAACKTCDPLRWGADFGVPQLLYDLPDASERIQNVRAYITNVTAGQNASLAAIGHLCRNNHADCMYWASNGECVVNAQYMKQNCAPACKSCDALLFENRCPLDPNAVNAWLAGDLDRTFARIANSKVLNSSIPYDVEVLSAPFMTGDPWVIVLDNFLTREETDHLVSLGEMEGFEQSYEVSTELNPDGSFKEYLSDYRTSSTSWCKQESGCYGNATVQHVLDRISGLLQIPTKNAEAIQFLKYTKGQSYNVHHDYNEVQISRQPGVRILTFFLYLNDVEMGGETNFDHLNLTVTPKRGRALLWPSVLDHDPDARDPRTTHQACPVMRGTKYAANLWFHRREWEGPLRSFCI